MAACAIVAYLGALGNRFAMDDLYIIVANPLVRSLEGVWRAFASPYWPPELGGKLYRPLPVATYALDWLTTSTVWFHAVNLLWHAGASAAVAALARRWAGDSAALVAGLLFAVHPVHVEAVANVVGRAELMAALFTLLAVYAALERRSAGWSAAALAAGLLCKENAAVAPGLVAWAWVLGFAPPTRRQLGGFILAWTAVGAGYLALRWAVLHPYTRLHEVAPVFVGEGPVAMRLTAVAALADVARLLVFPLTLRADYSPVERTIVRSVADGRFVLGLLVFGAWLAVVVWAWRTRRRVEALGLGWVGLAYLPVANLLIPVGILVAERTLYLPSAGLVLALGGWWRDWPARRLFPLLAVLVLAGGLRTALRVPVWRNDVTLTESMLDDSPRSYRSFSRSGGLLLSARHPDRALEALRRAIAIYDRDAAVYVAAADAAFTLGRPALADSLLALGDRWCTRCTNLYRVQARAAYSRGDRATAEWLLGLARRIEAR